MNLFNSLPAYFRHRLGMRAQKIPLDAGSQCPNRDGTLSHGGCIFCNPLGAGSGLGLAGKSIEEQWDIWRQHYALSGRTEMYIAYLQSFSNTYGSHSRISSLLARIEKLDDVSGLSIGTRPDCLDDTKLQMLADASFPEVWLELGVQTSHNRSLQRINRGHTSEVSEWAIRAAAEKGLRVCAHLIFGLPDETEQDMLDTVHWINTLPVLGIKFHSLYVCEHTKLAQMWRRGDYVPMEQAEYIDILIKSLAILRSDIVVHRLIGDPDTEELLAPTWAGDKRPLMLAIDKALRSRGLWQGCQNDAATRPLWYDNPVELSRKRLYALENALAELRSRNPYYEAAPHA